MASLLTSSQTTAFSGAFGDLFDTLAPHNRIIIYKEPIKTLSISNPLTTPGYPNYNNENIDDSNVTYTAVTGIYNGIIINKKNNKFNPFSEVKSVFFDGDIAIKVQEDAKNFIKNGKTEKIEVNNSIYHVISSEWTQNYLGLKYYYFALKVTN